MMARLETMQTERSERIWKAQSWLRTETLESLAELNEQCLELLCEQARTGNTHTAPPLIIELRDLWKALDTGAKRRASWCPYLLADAGFLEARRWAWVRGQQVHDQERLVLSSFFTAPRTISVIRLVLAYAWHLARSQNSAARLLLGMSAQCAELIASCTLRQMAELAEHHPEWLQPRWPGRVTVWRELLITSITGDTTALEQVRMRGLQLLAAEARAGVPLDHPRYTTS